MRYCVMRSPIKNVDASEVSFTIMINSLPSAGRIVLSACGTRMYQVRWNEFMPRLMAASLCPASTD